MPRASSARATDPETVIVVIAEVGQVAVAIQHQRTMHAERPRAPLEHAGPVLADAPVGIVVFIGAPLIHDL